MKKLILVILFLLVITQVVNGADKSEFVFYGFSGDAKYCAYELYGFHDGSGFAYSNIYILDTEKNCIF